MKRRGFLGSLLGLAAAKIAGVKMPEVASEPIVTSGFSQVAGVAGQWDGVSATMTTSTNAMNGSMVWLVDGKYILDAQEVQFTYTAGS